MANTTQLNTNIRMTQDTKELFDTLFEESGANSKGEFVSMLLDRYENPPIENPIEKIIEVEKPIEVEKLVEVEKQLQANQLLLTLSDAELFALRETVLSFSDFAERQNKLIDLLLPENKPFIGGRVMYSPEIFALWVRNRPISKKMNETEIDKTIRFNMGAFLRNMFLLALVDDKIAESLVTPEILMEFIQRQNDPIEE